MFHGPRTEPLWLSCQITMAAISLFACWDVKWSPDGHYLALEVMNFGGRRPPVLADPVAVAKLTMGL